MLESGRKALRDSLQQIQSAEGALPCLQTLSKYFTNALKEGANQAMRKILTSNEMYNSKVKQCTGGEDFLIAAGFARRHPYLELGESALQGPPAETLVKEAYQLLQDALAARKPGAIKPQAVAASLPPSDNTNTTNTNVPLLPPPSSPRHIPTPVNTTTTLITSPSDTNSTASYSNGNGVVVVPPTHTAPTNITNITTPATPTRRRSSSSSSTSPSSSSSSSDANNNTTSSSTTSSWSPTHTSPATPKAAPSSPSSHANGGSDSLVGPVFSVSKPPNVSSESWALMEAVFHKPEAKELLQLVNSGPVSSEKLLVGVNKMIQAANNTDKLVCRDAQLEDVEFALSGKQSLGSVDELSPFAQALFIRVMKETDRKSVV